MSKEFLFRIVVAWLCVWLGMVPGRAQQESASQEADAFFIRRIYDEALTHCHAWDWLWHLSEDIGGRLAGSPQAAAAVAWTKQVMDTLGFDTVWLQPCMAPRWVRGHRDEVRVAHSALGAFDLDALSLGNAVGTGPDGVLAEVVEVFSLDEVDSLGEAVRDKIVFYNRPMNPRHLNTFHAYGEAVDQRVWGASRAARYGALGVVVRSMTTRLDDVPHTGSLRYEPGAPQIPALAISTRDAELLHDLLRKGPVTLYLHSEARILPPVRTYNVIGEIRGSKFPDEIILVGGHLDSWDVGGGAHDDGAGCVHAMAVIELLRKLNYRPGRTIRCVLFMNEENGLAGARAYWAASDSLGEFHMAAIESDRGGFTPRGFTADALPEVFHTKFRAATEWLPLLEPYGLTLEKGGSGADIRGLRKQGGLLFGLKPDPQRYFDYHHTAIDHIDAVNRRELELGAAAMTTLVYLLDKYGLPEGERPRDGARE